jgi:hypothetical protein
VGAVVEVALGATDAGTDGGAELVTTDGDGDGPPACWPPRKSHHSRTRTSATTRTARSVMAVLLRRYGTDIEASFPAGARELDVSQPTRETASSSRSLHVRGDQHPIAALERHEHSFGHALADLLDWVPRRRE